MVHPADADEDQRGRLAAGARARRSTRAYLSRQGVPPEVVAAVSRGGERSFAMARRVAAVRHLRAGEVLETRHLALEVMHMPGHTPCPARGGGGACA